MSNFLTGKKLEDKLTDIIWNAKKYVIIISPYIKLDNHVKSIFEKIKTGHEVKIHLIFGKNENSKYDSFNKNDFDYFKEFKNISILYLKDLHAKHYCNEREGLITSLNLYDYSLVNNIEYGVYFSKTVLNPIDKLFEETERFTNELIFEKSEVVFLKRPRYKKKMFGLTKSYLDSSTIFDISDSFFRGEKYDSKSLCEFENEHITDIDKVFNKKPQRQDRSEQKKSTASRYQRKEKKQFHGFCIRTGEQIPFNPERPFSYNAYKTWSQFENYDYGENYCHKTGKRSNGKTSMRNPIL
ncbi:phospholipase D family protein [uncultured Kordia sp.]|uniref:phospholipase D family protein n=1 Tax=uncultured Kordia sp. TaxID=507699 RepID=UPI0026099686|nr:phospholipase D family protein [uncultured Kordia sp.]